MQTNSNHSEFDKAFGLHANANLSAAIKEGLGATWMQTWLHGSPWNSHMNVPTNV